MKSLCSHTVGRTSARTTPTLRLGCRFASSLSACTEERGEDQEDQRKVHIYSSLRTTKNSTIDYAKGWAWQTVVLQQQLLRKRQGQRTSDSLLLLEHYPVYTLGRGADLKHLTILDSFETKEDHEQCIQRLQARGQGSARLEWTSNQKEQLSHCLESDPAKVVQALSNMSQPVMLPNNVPVYRVERGGEVTFHNPGQLVVYPILDLTHHKQDLRWYLYQMEQVIIDTLQTHYGLASQRDAINPGVWVGQNKLAAVGVAASSWMTTHGFCINLTHPEARILDAIVPCGLEGRGVTSLEMEMGAGAPTMDELVQHLVGTFQRRMAVSFASDYIRIA